MMKLLLKKLRRIVTLVAFTFFTCSLLAQDAADGAAIGTTGGHGGQTVTVNSLLSFKTYAESSTPYIILVSGDISSTNNYIIKVNSNKTIVGLGSNAGLSNIKLQIINKTNIIIRNLTVKDSFVEGDWDGKTNDNDGIQVDNSSMVWIDHCHFTRLGDGCVDLRKGTDKVTVSWCKFSDHNKTFGLGWTDQTEWEVTIHHCWFENTYRRNPSFDQGKGHLYNNYLNNCQGYGNLSRGNARVIVENSHFENVKNPLSIWGDDALLYSSGNTFRDCTGSQSGNTSTKPWIPEYNYSLDAVSDVKSIVTSGAGPKSHISDQYKVVE